MGDVALGASALPGQRPLTSTGAMQASPSSCTDFCFLPSPQSSEPSAAFRCPACQYALPPEIDGLNSTDESTASLLSARGITNVQDVLKQVYAKQEHLELRLEAAIAELLDQQFCRLVREFSQKMKAQSTQDVVRNPAAISTLRKQRAEKKSQCKSVTDGPLAVASSIVSSPVFSPRTPTGDMNTSSDSAMNKEESRGHPKLMAAPMQAPKQPPPSHVLPHFSEKDRRFLESPDIAVPRSVNHLVKNSPRETLLRGSPQIRQRSCATLGPQKPCPQPVMHQLPEKDGTEDGELETMGYSKNSVSSCALSVRMEKLSCVSEETSKAFKLMHEEASRSAHTSGAFNASARASGALEDLKCLRKTTVAQRTEEKMKAKNKPIRNLLKPRKVVEGDFLSRLINDPFFDTTCALVIVLNSILIGITTEYLTDHDGETTTHIILGQVCSLFFLVELLLRLRVHGMMYFSNQDRHWNWFDFALVMFSIADFGMWATVGNEGAGSIGSTLKIVKMLRIVRIFRVFRFFKELSLLALMIMDSLRSLAWALLMLTIIIYVFAICFTQSATEYMKDLKDDKATWSTEDQQVQNQFGSLARTIYALVRSMLDGVSWGIVCDTLIHMDAFSATLFFCYISFTVLAVLNIITGVFVDNAVETAKTEREFLIQKEMELREKLTLEMRDLFQEMDEDGSGSVSYAELQEFFADERVKGYFQVLGLEGSDTERLFRLLDTNGKGEVEIDEFLEGCIRLKGEARSIDVHSVMFECRKIMSRLDEWDQLLEDDVNRSASFDSPSELQSARCSSRSKNGVR